MGWRASAGIIKSCDYLGSHLYNTAAGVITASADMKAIYACGILYALWLAVYLDGRLKGWTRSIGRTVVILGVIGVAWKYKSVWAKINLAAQFKGLNWINFAIAKDLIVEFRMQLVVLLICLVIGVYVLMRSSRRRKPGEREPFISEGVKKGFGRLPGLLTPILVIFVALNVVAGGLRARAAYTVRSKPNIILIMMDTTRIDHIGCYGYARNTTPNIDELARHSIRFERAISQAPWTEPSVSSFMTSQYPQALFSVDPDDPYAKNAKNAKSVKKRSMYEYQAPSNSNDPNTKNISVYDYQLLKIKFTTMAEILKDQGYATGAATSNPLLGAVSGCDRGFDYWNLYEKSKKDDPWSEKYTSPAVMSFSEKWLDQVKGKRFFLFSLFFDPHSPYVRHPECNFDPEYRGKSLGLVSITDNGGGTIPLDKLQCSIEHVQSTYDSEIAYTDKYIGSLIEKLKKDGLYDNSIIILMGDHGEEFGDHGALFHGHTLYSELLSVPLIIKLPHQNEGRVVKGKFALIDLLPSIMQEIGADPSTAHLSGKPVSLNDVKRIPDGLIFSATRLNDNDLRSVQTLKYKYILGLDKSGEKLFDLIADPSERHNILSEQRDIAFSLKKQLLEHEREATNAARTSVSDGSPRKDLSNEEKAKLRSLGYAN